ncbi:MAG: tetratricopeptide repeat protein [Muribaculaceae bacterium]|nr:tetratricopeptide repeat protein [Muribaculaceae bacterium]
MRHFLISTLAFVAFSFGANASSPKYMELADSADNYIKRERWSDAESTIISALRLEPGNFSNALLLSNLGVVRTNLGKMEEALEAFRLGLSVAPKSSVIRTNRARTFLLMGDYENALSDINETLEIDSIQEWPLQMRGLLLLGNDEIENARKDFTRLSKLNPRNSTAMAGLARVAEKEGNFNDALKLYDEAINIDDNPETRFSRILLKINMENYSDASQDIVNSIKIYPEHPDFYIARGYLHLLNFRNQEASIDRKIALDKGADPQLVEQFIPERRR